MFRITKCNDSFEQDDINSHLKSISKSKSNTVTIDEPILKQKRCKGCKMPHKSRFVETWRKFCNYCWVKINGVKVKCKGCDRRISVYQNKVGDVNFCIDCYKKFNGVAKVCGTCVKTYYFMEKYDDDKNCGKCHYKSIGIKRKCLTCKSEMFILKEDKDWRKRCYDCWLNFQPKI